MTPREYSFAHLNSVNEITDMMYISSFVLELKKFHGSFPRFQLLFDRLEDWYEVGVWKSFFFCLNI